MDLDSDSIATLAADIGDGLCGARLHGAMAGALCGGGGDGSAWQALLESALGDTGVGDCEPELRQMLALSEAALADPGYGFEPMLPGDDEPLAVRVQALADWCDAFVLAYAAAARDPEHEHVSDDAAELLADLTAIAGGLDAEAMGEDEDEDDEEDFMQILEFVRIATLNLFAERRPGADAVLH